MKLPKETIIAEAKITQYLLRWKAEDDKSKFLAKAGYTITTAKQLQRDLREQILLLDAVYTETDRFGDKYEIRGTLTGLNGVSLEIVTIWMIEFDSGQTKFITLYPNRSIKS
ncbi:DUF6883 domain-containing protein [Crocosphaera sp. XPORK-15E]|uniref:DUF6883 domain-containing protein n=1 Tax=Crocosphaera sp. XPORK-15E TaxID=3110247 RepID=UPI002B200034|nr:DUF6883 domain-containing protein [Crocosphaera sp. XPORK-15E]MEA5536489.1 hypothetical protein [Crocosphaera sp. XPORK-15E]